ncbi:MAG: thioredoxin family protein [Candidatus Methanosuratincola sp.]|nr:thioredoxin family protein [Candidatus Methanosuratincola sp.]
MGGGLSGLPKDLDDRSFDDFVREARYAAVLFWSGSCMPCRMVSLIFDELQSLRPGISFGKVNVGTSGVAGRLGVMSVPTILLFREGRKVARVLGVKPLQVLLEILDNYFSASPREDIYADSGHSALM